MNWLVTGGAGFIGSNFVHLLSRERDNHRIVVLDALTYAGNLANIADLNKDICTFVRGDICDINLVERLLRKYDIDCIINFAAESHVDRSILDPKTFIRTNVDGTFTLLHAARTVWENRQDVRFMQVSTDEVFGALELSEEPFSEQSNYCPNSPYSASKAAADHLARAWYHTYHLPVIVTNCSNNYGPYQFPEKLIPLMILNALENKALPIYGDGKQIRDWIHVEDHCRALLTLAEKGNPGEAYLIGANCEMTNLDVVHCICDKVDEILPRSAGTSRKLITYVKDRPGHDRRYAINSCKIKGQLGWAPRHHLPADMGPLIHWYMSHKQWADGIRTGEYLTYYAQQYAI